MAARAIVCVSNDLSNDQRVARSCLLLAEMGMEVEAVGRMHSRTPQALDFPAKQIRRFRLPFEKGKAFYAALNLRLFLHLLFSRFDLVLANDLDTLLPCYLVAKLKGKKIVYDSHEYFTAVPELEQRPGTRRVWERLELYLLPRIGRMITVNASIANLYAEKYGVHVAVVRNLPLRNEAAASTPKTKGRLIYQGALNMGRGIELMMEAMAFLPECELIIAGKGDVEAELKAKAKNNIRFMGHVPPAELKLLTAGCVLGLSLEENLGENYRLALPNKVFDYIQAGVPVLVSDLPEMAALVKKEQCGWVLKESERSAELLAKTIREILGDASAWAARAEACKAAAKELVWENEKEVMRRFLQETK